jgi:DNA-binding response OmpR family regulator
MKTVLLVEDDPSIRAPLSMYLERSGYVAKGISNGLEVMPFLKTNAADLIILDINLPGKDGLTLCREIRAAFSIPIIMLSARGGEEDKVSALEWGADDYVPKPFSPRELIARIGSVLKRATSKPAVAEKAGKSDITLGSLKLEGRNYRLTLDGTEIRLTKTEFLLLHRLASDA